MKIKGKGGLKVEKCWKRGMSEMKKRRNTVGNGKKTPKCWRKQKKFSDSSESLVTSFHSTSFWQEGKIFSDFEISDLAV